MADVATLPASPRSRAGKGSARQARRDGMVPAVIYGSGEEPVMIALERRLLVQELHRANFFIQLVDIDVGGTKHRVLPRDVQFHPVNELPLHADFLRFDASRRVTAQVPVVFVNDEAAPGLRRGGMLNIVRHEVEVECTADRIPQSFSVDLTGLDIGDSIHASMIGLPEGVAFAITDRDFTVATIAAPTVVAEEAAEAAEAEAAAEEEEEAEAGAGAEGEGGGEAAAED